MISIVIPAYNEEKRIGPSLLIINNYLQNKRMDHEIIVVDDGSGDRTSQRVKELTLKIINLQLIRYETNKGKGYAVRTGILASKGSLVLLTDADLSTPIEELSTLLPYVANGECEMAIGSRALPLSNIVIRQPWWRQGMGKIFNKIVKTFVIDDFSDTQCGFKLFAGDAARHLFAQARIDRFAYDVEILALARKEGLVIKEVPICWMNSPESRVNPITDSFRMLLDLLRIRKRLGSVKKNGGTNQQEKQG
jgi:dolichyl-phosphate beta-glucosyltransferase